MTRLQILTWQVHGNYMHYLSHASHDFHLVTRPGHPSGYAGRVGVLPWRDNVHEAPESDLAERRYDLVLYQSRRHYEVDRLSTLAPAQRAAPALYLEHDPPTLDAAGSRHVAAGDLPIVHVTDYNALMWDCGGSRVHVIDHGVVLPGPVSYGGERAQGIVVANHLAQRGRRLGEDLYSQLRRRVPLVLVGMDAKSAGGIGEIGYPWLAGFMARHRFYFHPARYTSLGLSLIEAMMIGMPVVGLATTELPTVIQNGRNGWIDNRPQRLIEVMHALIADRSLACVWGEAARRTANERFGIARFAADWDRVLRATAGLPEGLTA